jgi:hypothetical protein
MQNDDNWAAAEFQPFALDQNRGSALTAGLHRDMAGRRHGIIAEGYVGEPCQAAEKAGQGESRRNAALPPRGYHKVVSRFTAFSELFASAATVREGVPLVGAPAPVPFALHRGID